MSHETRTAQITVVQYAPDFPAGEAGWRMSPSVIPLNDADAIGSTIATAELQETLGAHVPPGTSGNRVVDRRTAVLRPGMAVRLLVSDPNGTITGVLNRTQVKFTAYWWGTVVGKSREITGGDDAEPLFGQSRTITWACEEARGMLARMRVTCSIVAGAQVNRVIPFNETYPGGNCSADGTAFDLSGSGEPWTHQTAIDYLLANHARPRCAGMGGSTGSLTWVVDWSASLLQWLGADSAWLPYLDPRDRDVLSLIEQIAASSRGLTWTYAIVGQVATITFRSLSPTGVSYTPAGSPTVGLGANTPQDLDLRYTRFVTDPQYLRDSTGYDYIVVMGDRPLRHVTFRFPGDLIPDVSWTTSDPADDEGDPSGLTGAWRVFQIAPTWNPGALSTTDPFLRAKISSDPNGLPDGVRSYGTTLPLDALDLTDRLGIENSDGGTGRPGGEQGAILISNPSNATLAEDQSDAIQIATSQWPPRIILGTSAADSQTIRDWFDTYTPVAFAVTIGVREWEPLQVAWMRPRAQWPSSTPRVLQYPLPDAQEISRSNRALVGVDTSGNVIGGGGGSTTFRDNTPMVALQLALLRGRYEVEGGTVTWTSKYQIDIATSGPTALGAMIGNVLTPEGSEVCNAVISMRQRDHVAKTTSYTTLRPDFLPELQ